MVHKGLQGIAGLSIMGPQGRVGGAAGGDCAADIIIIEEFYTRRYKAVIITTADVANSPNAR